MEISTKNLQSWYDAAAKENRLKSNAFTTHDMQEVLVNRDVLAGLTGAVFSTKIDKEGSPITHQKMSGRCWLFAMTNVLRIGIAKKYNLEEFQLSPSYLFFWDKLEKANYFLKSIIETKKEETDSRLIQHLLDSPIGDGGQFDMIVNIVEKYGIVPNSVYPESFTSSKSQSLNWLVTTKLREYAQQLREASSGHDGMRLEMMAKIFSIMCATLGKPPGVNDSFTWKFEDKDKKFHSIKTTPMQFYKEHTGFDMEQHVSLLNDPRNSFRRVVTVDYLGNVVGGHGIRYLNLPMSELIKTAIGMLKDNEPVFFGSDTQQMSREHGLFTTEMVDFEAGFNVTLKQNKADRLRYHQSLMTHAMVFTAVDLDEQGNPLYWRIENSWGDTMGKKGYFTASAKWVEEFVYQVSHAACV